MTYSDLPVADLIIHAAEFVGRGLSIPPELKATLGPDLTHEIENPEKAPDEEPQQPINQ